MEIKLSKRPKSPIIIGGFPGFGLVGTIATEFLIDHLKTEQIGKINFNEAPAMIAIHEGRIVEPFGIFYNKQFNVVIIHAISSPANFEWKLAEILNSLAKQVQAKEIICLEGVGSGSAENAEEEDKVFYYSSDEKKRKLFEKLGVNQLKEGIIIGVTGAILLRADSTKVSCVFAETHTKLPDSKAAAKIIGVLDGYLGLKVDYKPLLAQAEKFEEKLKTIMQKTMEAKDVSEKKKQLNYVG